MSDCNHDCSSCASNCAQRTEPESFLIKPHATTHIKKVIGIVSGKGGVGKSLVTSLLAASMQKKGCQAAVLDADITGPSIPKVFGVTGEIMGDDEGMYPAISDAGVKIMSTNLLLDNEAAPTVWRGPVIAGIVKQFYQEVLWGDVDYMFVDMPPGTGDVPLTVFQSLPLDGIVIVTSPQELVSMIVGKALNMAHMMDVPVLGIVENMSYFVCPNCEEKHYIYGESHVEELAEAFDIQHVAKIPINPKIAELCDEGKVEEVEADFLEEIMQAIM